MQQFGNYDLINRIDVGGMGEVYLAHQRSAFGREVAVKIIRSDLVHDMAARQRFLREAEVSSYLKHEHILPLFEFGEEQGRLFLVTPYIKGGTLGQRLQNGPLPISEVQQLFSALLQAVSYLHKRNVIHRDLKPSNILLDRAEDSNRIYVRLIDFGIASIQGSTTTEPLASSRQEMGTAAYMAPERLDGIVGPSNDIYSLGIILYEMLTGRLVANEDIVSLPQPLEYVIQHCTARDPYARFASVDELLTVFEKACKSLTSSRMSAIITPSAKPDFEETIVDETATIENKPPTQTIKPLARESQPSRPVRNISPQNRASRPDLEATQLEEQPSRPVRNIPQQEQPSRPVRSVPQQEQPSRPIRSVPQEKQPSRPVRSVPQEQPSRPVRSVPQEDYPSRPARNAPLEDYPSRPDWNDLEEEEEDRPSRPARNMSPKRSRPSRADFNNNLEEDAEQPSNGGQTELRLPPLPGRASSFSGADYDAPTSFFNPSRPEMQQAVQDAPISRPPRRKRKKPTGSFLVLISILTIVVIMAIFGLGALALQSSITATVNVTPRVQPINSVLNLTAIPGPNQKAGDATSIPAYIYSSTQQGSKQGATSGISSCVLGVFECKQSVSFNDISVLAEQVRTSVRGQLDQDLHKKASNDGATIVGKIVYQDVSIAADPPVGTVNKTVTVSLTEQGSVEGIKSKEVHDRAVALLKSKLPAHYVLIDSLTQVGQPAVQQINTNGNVSIAIAAAGIARYQVSASEVAALQNHIKGMSQKDARAFIARQSNLDPDAITIHISYGETIPNNAQQIKLTVLNPERLPPVQLPAVPTAAATT